MAAILDAILDFEECQQGISGDFLSVILHIFLDLSWKNQLVTKNVHLLGSMNLTGFRELPYILILLCNNINQIYANIIHTSVE